MLDLTEPKSSGTGHLTKMGARRDGTKENRLIFDVEVAFQITTPEDAVIVDKVIPGAERCWMIGIEDEDAQANYTRIIGDPCGHTQFVDSTTGVSVDATSDILRVQLKGSRRGMFLVIKTRLHGLKTEEAASLLDWLNGSVEMCFEHSQQALVFPVQAIDENEMEIVSVATVNVDPLPGSHGQRNLLPDTTIFGQVSEVDGKWLTIENFGSKYRVLRSDVVISLMVRADPGNGVSIQRWIVDFEMACIEGGGSPQWEHVIIALGQSIQEMDDDVVLTADVIQKAVEICKAA